MPAKQGYMLILRNEREEAFQDSLGYYGFFSEPVRQFAHNSLVPLLCFISTREGRITHVAKAKKSTTAGTGLRRLKLDDIITLKKSITFVTILTKLPKRFRHVITGYLNSGGLIAPKSFESLVELMQELAPEVRGLLSQFGQAKFQYIESLPTKSRQILAYQKEAIQTALKIAGSGLQRETLENWTPAKGAPSSFLDGLPKMRANEDAIIINDMQKIPGFEKTRALAYPGTVFENEFARLTIVLANKLPLELQTGTDLIYYNETFKSFVMVQYKAMENDGTLGAVFRFPNAQLTAEIERMEGLLKTLKQMPTEADHNAFRFSQNPFFLKLCPRMNFNPDDATLSKGMYIHLDHWHSIVNSEDKVFIGVRGGKRITYDNIGRYLNNTEFVGLITKAWVGSTPSQSLLLQQIIREVVENGKSAVIAIKSEKETTVKEGDSPF